VNVPGSGTYTIDYYTSTPLDGSTIEFRLNGDSIVVDAVPNNGSWDIFTTSFQSSGTVTMIAGDNTIRIVAGTNAWQWNMDKFVLTKVQGIAATFNWTEFTGLWWLDGYSYTETQNGVTMVHGGRAAAYEGGFALKASYSADATDGTFDMQIGGVNKQFVVTSIDISAGVGPPNGEPMVEGMLNSVQQWAIDPTDGVGFLTYTTATSGDMGATIDQIIWSAPYDPAEVTLTWSNNIDNLNVLVTP